MHRVLRTEAVIIRFDLQATRLEFSAVCIS